MSVGTAHQNLWIRGDLKDLPCFDPAWDPTNVKWLDQKILRMSSPVCAERKDVEDEIYQIQVAECGTMSGAYNISAISVRPIKYNWVFRRLDAQDVQVIRVAAEMDTECDFFIEWDDKRPRHGDRNLEEEIDAATELLSHQYASESS